MAAIIRLICLIVGIIMIVAALGATPINVGLLMVGVIFLAIGGVGIIIFGDIDSLFGND